MGAREGKIKKKILLTYCTQKEINRPGEKKKYSETPDRKEAGVEANEDATGSIEINVGSCDVRTKRVNIETCAQQQIQLISTRKGSKDLKGLL